MSRLTVQTIGRSVLASAAATILMLAGLSAPAAAAVPMTLSKAYGTSGAGGTLIASITPSTSAAPFPIGSTPVVQFQFIGTATTGCATNPKARAQIAVSGVNNTAGVLTADPATVKRITSWKIVFQVPTASYPGGETINPTGLVLMGTQTQSKWYVCVYDSDSLTATLLSTASYTVTLKPRITAITPASSPAVGGQTITVQGVGFTPVSTPLTASIGGVALSNIKVAASGTSFTATTGARAPGTGLELSVVAPGGTVSSLDPDNDPVTNNPITFAYTNGITVSPNTGVSGTLVTLAVTGAGFTGVQFDSGLTPTSSLAHVVLVSGAYDPSNNRGLAECSVGVVVSDTELICDLDLTPNTIPDGAYIITVVANGDPNAGVAANPSIISSGAAFVIAPY